MEAATLGPPRRPASPVGAVLILWVQRRLSSSCHRLVIGLSRENAILPVFQQKREEAMKPLTLAQARRVSPGRLLFFGALTAAMLAVVWSPLALRSIARAADASPTFVYQTNYDGGPFDSGGKDEVVDDAGDAYVLEGIYDSIGRNDVLVLKLSPTGAVLFTTYLRGSAVDYGTGLALDGNGGLWVVGFTDSPDFPVVDAAQPVMDARRSGFIARLSTSNGAILYSSFFGGNGADQINDLSIGPNGDIYLTGTTDSTDLPVVNPLQATLRSANDRDAFVERLSPDARTVLYGTYLGGSNYDEGNGIALDAAGNIYVAGDTQASDFPTVNAVQSTWGGDYDAWTARISADGSHLDYSTYLGGSRYEAPSRISVDPAGYLTVTGSTNSANYPTTPGTAQPVATGDVCGTSPYLHYCYDGFVTRLAPNGALVYSTFLGGSLDNQLNNLAVDAAGNVTVIGYSDFAAAPPDYLPTSGIYLASLDASVDLRTSLVFDAVVPNSSHGLALGPDGDLYFTGVRNPAEDLYAARLALDGGPAPTPTPTPTPAATPTPTPSAAGLHVADLDGSATANGRRFWRAGVTVLVQDAGHGPVANVTVAGRWSRGYSGSAQCVTSASGTCTLSTGSISRLTRSATFTITNLTGSGYTYTPSANTDPDGDSDGTTIVVSRP
jgi:hypothetical protein